MFSWQDPTSLDKFNLANFHHLKNNLKVVNEGQSLVFKKNCFLTEWNKRKLSTVQMIEVLSKFS